MPCSVRTLKPCHQGGCHAQPQASSLENKELRGQPIVAPYAALTAGSDSSVSQRYGPAIIPQDLVAENGLFQPKLKLTRKISKIDPSSGLARGRDEVTDPMPFEYDLPEALTQPGSL